MKVEHLNQPINTGDIVGFGSDGSEEALKLMPAQRNVFVLIEATSDNVVSSISGFFFPWNK